MWAMMKEQKLNTTGFDGCCVHLTASYVGLCHFEKYWDWSCVETDACVVNQNSPVLKILINLSLKDFSSHWWLLPRSIILFAEILQ